MIIVSWFLSVSPRASGTFLPPALRGLVQEIESYRSTKATILEASFDVSLRIFCTKAAEIFFVARRLIDYMEFHVIGNDSVLKRLKVA